jgi:HSP20 family protein
MAIKSLIPFSRESSRLPPSMRSGFGNLQREIDRVFDEFTSNFGLTSSTEHMPKMDARESDSEVELTVELPGLEEKDVNVSIADGVLTIRGEKSAEDETKDGDYHYRERSYGSFFRSISIPPGIDESKIKATLKKGLLTVTIPKTPAAKAKKIEVTSSG